MSTLLPLRVQKLGRPSAEPCGDFAEDLFSSLHFRVLKTGAVVALPQATTAAAVPSTTTTTTTTTPAATAVTTAPAPHLLQSQPPYQDHCYLLLARTGRRIPTKRTLMAGAGYGFFRVEGVA